MDKSLVLELYPGANILDKGSLEAGWRYYVWQRHLGRHYMGGLRSRPRRAAALHDGYVFGFILENEKGAGDGKFHDKAGYASQTQAYDAMMRTYLLSVEANQALKLMSIIKYQARSLLVSAEKRWSYAIDHSAQVITLLAIGLIFIFFLIVYADHLVRLTP